MQAPPRGRLVVRRLAVAALGCGRPYRGMRAWPGRVLAGLIVGLLVLALPGARGARPSSDVPSVVESPVMPPPAILACGWGESAVLSPPEARQAATGPQVPPPQDRLVRDDVDGANDDASSPPGPMRGGCSLPCPSPRGGVTGMTAAVPWPVSYLVRPQRLTRPSPLPVGRAHPRPPQMPCRATVVSYASVLCA
jgi:hypothetical protein